MSDLDSWQTDARIAARGFTHPWRSRLAEGNGEDHFLATLDRLVRPDDLVLDLGCGHGELTIALAARARAAIGVDRDPGYLALARELAEERDANARFLDFACTEGARLPLPDDSITLVVNRRGPTAEKWLAEIIRVARPGAEVLLMHPAGGPPAPSWLDELPPALAEGFGALPYDQVRSWVETPLAEAGITNHTLSWHDVPEWFTTADDLHRRLTATPPTAETSAACERIIARHPEGVALRQQRLIARFRLGQPV